MCIMVPEIVVPELRVNDQDQPATSPARDAQSSLDACLTCSNYLSFLDEWCGCNHVV